jgi:hypothetical protein
MLSEWLKFCDLFLDELLRHDGLGDAFASAICSACGEREGTIKCTDCFTQHLHCRHCVVKAHSNLPLHWIEVSIKLFLFIPTVKSFQEWTGKFFDKITLQSLGLRFQLGHGGLRCPLPVPGPSDFMVFDTTGVHCVAVDFCNCTETVFHRRTQLLRARWFPATVNRPKTVFTFDALWTFHKHFLQGKTTAFDFYHTIL